MINPVRLAANAAAHTAAGAVFGVVLVLAACTVARTAKVTLVGPTGSGRRAEPPAPVPLVPAED